MRKRILIIVSGLIFFIFTLYFLPVRQVHAQESLITNITATASTAYSNPQNAVDGNPSGWSSGSGAPQWVMLDLGSSYTINKIVLTVLQSPPGRTVNNIDVGSSPTSLSHLITLDQITHGGQKISIPLLKPVPGVRYIKITTTVSPSWVAWQGIEVYQGTTTSTSTHLKYFGYLDAEWYNPLTTYFPELDALGNTNIAWSLPKDIATFANHRLLALIPADFFWASDWQTYWQEYQKQINPYINDVYGFNFDEPFSRHVSENAFLTATKAIHDTYPGKAIMVTEAAPEVVNQTFSLNAYQYVTDVSFDYYFVSDSANNDQGWAKYLDIFEKYKPFMQGRKVWFIPDGWGGGTTRWPDAWERYISLAMSTDNAAGLLGFIYNESSDLLGYPSLRSVLLPSDPLYLPAFRARQIEVGKAIIANAPPIPTPTPTPRPTSTPTPKPTATPTPTPTPKPGDLNGDGKVDIFDYNLLVAKFGKTGTAGFSPADINKNGKVDIFDYNILVGNFGK